MTSQIDPTKSYKTYYTKTYLDGIDPAIYPFLVTKGYSNGSETIVAGEYLDGVLLVANQTEPDVIVDAAGDPVCFWGLNGASTTGVIFHPGAATARRATSYVLTPTQTVGASATSSTVNFVIPSVAYNTEVLVHGRQIAASSYVGTGGNHFVRMTTNFSSTGPAILTPITRDATMGFGGYTGDSAEMHGTARLIVPANTPSFTIGVNCSVSILGVGGAPSALGTSAIFLVEQLPVTGVIA